jgi:hypothetical protein
MAGSTRPQREAVKSKNLGINQPTAERTSVKLATAIKAPKTIDISRREDFSAGHDLFQNHPIFSTSLVAPRLIMEVAQLKLARCRFAATV